MQITQSVHTIVTNTSKRNCQITVAGGPGMFKFSMGPFKRDNGSTQNASEHFLYTEELDSLIECLIKFRELNNNTKIV